MADFPYLSYNTAPSVVSGVQSPFAGDAATLAAMADARAKQTALQQVLHRAAVLREEPMNAQGQGPLGARQGVGPAGWAVTAADAIAGAIAKNRRQQAAIDVTKAMGALSPAEQEYVNQYLKSDPASMQNGPRYGKPDMSYVPQGSPLSLGNQ